MDSLDAQHKLSIAWHKTAKFMSADIDTWRNRSILCAMSMAMVAPFFHPDPDKITNDNTAAMQEQLQAEFTALAANGGLEQQRDFLQDLLRADDLSERQTADMLGDFHKAYGSYTDVLGYRIGNIGDLRESRAAVGTEDMQKLAAYNLEQSADEDFIRMTAITTALMMIPLAFLGLLPAFRREAGRDKPRNPKFKH